MKKGIFLLTFLSFILGISATFAEIIRTSNLTPLKSAIQKANFQTLVVFDIDDVLIMPDNELRFTHPDRRKYVKDLEKRVSKEKFKILRSIVLRQRSTRLVDSDIIEILADLKRRKILTVALTKIWTGKFGIIEKVENWRIKNLQTVGINFTPLFPFKGELVFDDLHTANGSPLLKAGIIFTANLEKGIVLERVLDELGFHFRKILFIDDNLQNLKSVEKLCIRKNIKFMGYEYMGASQVSSPIFDARKDLIRFNVLEKKLKWLNDKEVEKN